MAVLFVSHSNKDDALASALEAWLHANGFTDIFIDHGMAGGTRWQEELRASVGACRVIICLITENWLSSPDCFGEFAAASYMGKRIIPLFLIAQAAKPAGDAEQKLKRVRSADQGIDLAPCLGSNGLLDLEGNPAITLPLAKGLRMAGAQTRIGLDPETFAIDRALRPMPFPGLASFGDDDADAALFYGRSREIAEVLEDLRKVRAERDLRPLVILGASGAGKSSLLKAGIIPRLRRETPAWLPLRAFRPGADPFLNFAEALARTLADFGKVEAHGLIRDRLFAVWSKAERKDDGLTPAGRATLEAALEAEGRTLRAMANREGATILISIDQAEELARAMGEGADALADFLQAALALATSPWQLAFTIRTDSFPELQRHHRFQNLQARGYDLRAVPIFRYESVVKEPAKRYGVQIDEELVSALINDAPHEDALPLLAFALQRLWRRYAAAGAITAENYHSIGGLTSLIEDAAERALRGLAPDQDVPLPAGPPPAQRAALAATTFVPALAQLNEQGAVIRRAAPWNNFSAERQQLLLSFDQWHLVVRKAAEGDDGTIDAAPEANASGGGTVELAHEALFREWTRLKGWLEPERARLEALRSLQLDALTWDRNGRDGAFLNYRGRRLAEAVALQNIEAYQARLGAAERDYLVACQRTERLARRRVQLAQTAIFALFLGIITGVVGWRNQDWLKERVYVWRNVNALTATQEQALKPGNPFRECTDCPEMIVVPARSFLMGVPKGGASDVNVFDVDKQPQHKVTIAEPFAVSKFELTFAEWDTCAAQGGCAAHIPDGGWTRGSQPAINVSWYDAKDYVAWLSRITGKTYRLLSEAEYEYAARGGRQTVYPWGDDIKLKGQAMANCADCGSRWDGKQTAPVGSFAPNQFGLYDMLGNVSEWVKDCWHTNYIGAPTDGSAWIEGGNCVYHVVRGGSWDLNSTLGNLGSAIRFRDTPDVRFNDLGFRVARTLTP